MAIMVGVKALLDIGRSPACNIDPHRYCEKVPNNVLKLRMKSSSLRWVCRSDDYSLQAMTILHIVSTPVKQSLRPRDLVIGYAVG